MFTTLNIPGEPSLERYLSFKKKFSYIEYNKDREILSSIDLVVYSFTILFNVHTLMIRALRSHDGSFLINFIVLYHATTVGLRLSPAKVEDVVLIKKKKIG